MANQKDDDRTRRLAAQKESLQVVTVNLFDWKAHDPVVTWLNVNGLVNSTENITSLNRDDVKTVTYSKAVPGNTATPALVETHLNGGKHLLINCVV